MARVMLLGDSIRMSYQPHVAQLLSEHEVWGPGENCQFSLYTLASLGRWLTDFADPDVVHWNNGLHDIGHNPNRAPVQMPLEVYATNIGFIADQLQATGARVIFANSTPIHPERPFRQDQWSWRQAEIDAYNQAALASIQQRGIPVNDLHAVVAADHARFLGEDQLHLSDEGQLACAAAVAAAVRDVMP